MLLATDIRLTAAQSSRTGRKHRNEDCLGFYMPEGNLLATKGAVGLIADGVSTAEAGAEASQYCVSEFINDYFDTPDIWTAKKSAQKVLTAINRALYSRSHEYLSTTRGYVCTLSVVVIKSRTAHLFHIGDSRIYRLRKDTLELLTDDHTTPLSESNSCLSRAMGMDTHLEIDYRTVELEEGDIFLLSTDGVHDALEPAQMKRIIQQRNDLQSACETLTQAAYDAGSNDNLSCQLITVDELAADNIDELTDKLTRLPFPPELEPGMKIDGFLIERQLYASNRSQLYVVEDLEEGGRYVMKTPSQNFSDDPAYIERFIMEEWVGSRISNDHVVKIHHPNRAKHFMYYLMEHLEGLPLDEWILANPYPQPARAIEIIKQIAEGLNAFHQRETLHQDLKPSNVMVMPDDQVKIVDFGSVFVAGVNEIFVPIQRDRILGTMNYSDPVFRLGQNTGARGDQFSLAAIAYEIFTHQLPYGDALERCEKPQHLDRLVYIPADRHNPVIPVWFDRALEKALSIQPAERYDTLPHFMQDLTEPNPEFLTPRENTQQSASSVLFWQLMSLVWFTVSIFLLIAFWMT